MKVLNLFLLFFVVTSAAFASGDRAGNGGKGVAINQQLFLLDLVEKGIQSKVKAVLDIREIYPDAVPGPTIHIRHNIPVVVKSGRFGKETIYLVSDYQGLTILRALVKQSGSENDWMFGREYERAVCSTRDLPCFSEDALLAIAVMHRVHLWGGGVNFPGRFIEAFEKLHWMMIDAPLETINDDHSTIGDAKYMLASRVDNRIGIWKQGWSAGAVIKGEKIRPLDFANKAALITHEVIGSITQSQGDPMSDRAKMVNAILWGASDPSVRKRTVNNMLNIIPGRPAIGRAPFYVSELSPGQLIQVTRSINSTKEDYLVLKGGRPAVANSDANDKHDLARVELSSPRHFFDKGATIPAGTVYEVSEIYTTAYPYEEYRTTIILKPHREGYHQIAEIVVVGANYGPAFATIDEFVKASAYHLKLIKP